MEKKNPISKSDVLAAREKLLASGQKITYEAIKNTIGRGSYSTIRVFLAEIEKELKISAESQAAQDSFKTIWELAVATARKELQSTIDQLELRLKESCTEIGIKEDKIAELESAVKKVEEIRDGLIKTGTQLNIDLSNAQKALAAESVRGREALAQLSEANIAHAAVVSQMRSDLSNKEKQLREAHERMTAQEMAFAHDRSAAEQKNIRVEGEKSALAERLAAAEGAKVLCEHEVERLRNALDKERATADQERRDSRERERILHNRMEELRAEHKIDCNRIRTEVEKQYTALLKSRLDGNDVQSEGKKKARDKDSADSTREEQPGQKE